VRYVLTRDDDCHWYVIPADKTEAWDKLIYETDDDPEALDWVYRIGGDPSQITFENPEHGDEAIASSEN
jgi:hypothetical protein